jgi:hypothetical protein
MLLLYGIGIVFILLLDALFGGLVIGFIVLCANLWYITVPVLLVTWYQLRKEEKKRQAIQKDYDDLAYRINRNNVRYDQAKTTNEYKEVYKEYNDIINIINDNMMVELYEIRDKIKVELINLENKIRG